MREHIYIQNPERTPKARDRRAAQATLAALHQLLDELDREWLGELDGPHTGFGTHPTRSP